MQKLLKPILRGHFHQAAFFTALGACAMMIANAKNPTEVVSSVVYTIGLAGLLGVSALYHRPHWNVVARKWMRRLDHSMIFVLIAGTFTPVCLLALPDPHGINLLKITWMVAAFGTLQSLFWVTAPRWLSAILYVGFGWLIFPYLPELRASFSTNSIWMLFWGGLAYTLGAIVYALRRPDPSPRVFGYHEIFHLFVIIGAIFHFIMVNRLIG